MKAGSILAVGGEALASHHHQYAHFIMTQKQEYTPVSWHQTESEDEFATPTPTQNRRRPWLAIASSFALGILTTGIILAACRPYMQTQSNHREFPTAPKGTDPNSGLPLSWSNGDCGNSAQEALSHGCRYSIVLHSWLPQDCLTNEDIEDETLMYEDRVWPYETSSGKNLTMDQLRAGDYSHFTTTFDWHVTHCMFVWKRLHRVLMDPAQKIDTYTANFDHTKHCVKMIGGHAGGMKDSGTKIFVKYPKCK